MRKSLLLILVLLLTAVCACAAAGNEYPLSPLSGKIAVDESNYIVLTPDNLSEHPDLLTTIGKSAEELTSDWSARGVVLQAWTKNLENCVEIAVVQDDLSAKYVDLNAQDNGARKLYYKEAATQAREAGFVVTASEVENKLHKSSGYWVIYPYLLRVDGQEYRGIMRKTVRNGYTISVDYQKKNGRKPTKTDKDKGRDVINMIVIDDVAPAMPQTGAVTGQEAPVSETSAEVPEGAANALNVNVLPPDITNDGVFTVEGSAYPGAEVIVSAMRLSSSSSDFFSAIAGKNGSFKVKVTLPGEGVYTVSASMYVNNTPVADAFLNSVKYTTTEIPVTFAAEFPTVLSSDELVITGTTIKNVNIQCIAMYGSTELTVKPHNPARTNGTGSFTFRIPTKGEGEYNITLVFEKKGFEYLRRSFTATRTLTEEDTKSRAAAKAEKVSYNNLIKKLDSFIGRNLVFDAHIVKTEQVGEEWILTAALKLNKGAYSNLLIFVCKEDPGLAESSKVKLYGTCFGAYEIQSEEGTATYPGLDYLFCE